MKPAKETAPTRGLQVAKGIAAAHENHIIHRDIKPQNIIISRDGKVKVADFGIARAVSAQTARALALGSGPLYRAGTGQAWPAMRAGDIYSFGITMHRMVTGQVPFRRHLRGRCHGARC